MEQSNNSNSNELTSSNELKRLWNLIKPLGFGMFSTHHRHKIHSRPMLLVQEEFNGTLYFFTEDDSLKVAELTEEQEVGISFSSPTEQIYISVSGNARISKNKEMIESLWGQALENYFPEGVSDPHLALIEVKVSGAEVWSSKEGGMVQVLKSSSSFENESFEEMDQDYGQDFG